MIEMNGLRKASILMTALNAEVAAKVFELLSPDQRETLGGEIVRLRHIDEVTRGQVLREVSDVIRRGPMAGAQYESPSSEDDLSSVSWLEREDPDLVASILGQERGQTVALVLSKISPQYAASVLSRLTDGLRNDVVHRLAAIKPASPQAIQAISEGLRLRIREPHPTSDRGATSEKMLRILGSATDSVKESISGALSRTHHSSVERVVTVPISVEDLAGVPNSEAAQVIAETDIEDLCIVVSVGSDELRLAVLQNASDGIAEQIEDQIRAGAQYRVKDIEGAQERVIELMRRVCGCEPALQEVHVA